MNKYEIVDYRKFRFSKLNTPEFSHLKLLLYWPLFGLLFYTVERLWIRESYFPMYSPLDDMIPFCELFVIPYIFWFAYLVGIHVYTLFWDTEAFKKLMYFIMISYSIALITYIIFPNAQELRPMEFERDNFLTRFMAGFYQFDTNTNVCPSIHVIGSVAVMGCSFYTKHFSSWGWRIANIIITVLISVSTVFLKQHSIIDMFAAIPVCIISYYFAFIYKRKKK